MGGFEIRGQRVVLRDFALGDGPAVLAYHRDPEVMRFLPAAVTANRTPDAIRALIRDERADAARVPRVRYDLAVTLADEVIGAARLHRDAAAPAVAEIGYILRRDTWGRGLATETAGLLVAFGFETMGLARLRATVERANLASVRVLEKVGMWCEPTPVRDRSLAFAITFDEWTGAIAPTPDRYIPRPSTAAQEVPMVEDIEDPRRQEPPYVLDERDMLEAWLEFHRTTLLLKCEGLDDAARKLRPVPTSKLSLHGLVRHMAEVERNWFRRVLQHEADAPPIWFDPAVDDSELVPLDDADWGADLLAWEAECDASRRAAAAHELDDTGVRHGEPCSLRWIYVHMIEEYARHNGHADLIRELADGQVGW